MDFSISSTPGRTRYCLRLTRLVALLLPGIALLFGGCREDEPRQPVPRGGDSSEIYDLTFPPPTFGEGRKLDTILAIDLSGNGRVDYLVSSLALEGYFPPGTRADLVQIYQFDTATRSYRVVAADSIEWIESLELRDLTGDRTPEIVSRIHSGGNDPVASIGMTIYSGDGGAIRPVFRSRRGMPSFVDLSGNTVQAIVTHGELWPLFATHADAIVYIDDLFAWRNGRYVSVREERADFFMKLAESTLAGYRDLRKTVDTTRLRAAADSLAADSLVTSAVDTAGYRADMNLFNAAALSILYLQRAAAARSLVSFWSSERNFLQSALPTVFYQELEAIYVEGRRQTDAP